MLEENRQLTDKRQMIWKPPNTSISTWNMNESGSGFKRSCKRLLERNEGNKQHEHKETAC